MLLALGEELCERARVIANELKRLPLLDHMRVLANTWNRNLEDQEGLQHQMRQTPAWYRHRVRPRACNEFVGFHSDARRSPIYAVPALSLTLIF